MAGRGPLTLALRVRQEATDADGGRWWADGGRWWAGALAALWRAVVVSEDWGLLVLVLGLGEVAAVPSQPGGVTLRPLCGHTHTHTHTHTHAQSAIHSSSLEFSLVCACVHVCVCV